MPETVTDASPAEPSRTVPSRTLAWLWVSLLLVFAVHNAEEWWRDLPEWSADVWWWPGSALPVTQQQFGLAVALLTGTMLAVGAVAVTTRAAWSAEVLACFAVVLLINVGTHVVGSAATGTLMPGVVTGIALVMPVAYWVIRRLPRVRATWPAVAVTGALALVTMFGSLALAAWVF